MNRGCIVGAKNSVRFFTAQLEYEFCCFSSSFFIQFTDKQKFFVKPDFMVLERLFITPEPVFINVPEQVAPQMHDLSATIVNQVFSDIITRLIIVYYDARAIGMIMNTIKEDDWYSL